MTAAEAVQAILGMPNHPRDLVVGVADAYGADISMHGAGVGPDTAFDLASVTKVVSTTSALHRLASLGELSFDDPMDRWLPRTNCVAGTTLRDLLTHRAGLWEWQPFYLVDGPPLDVAAGLPLRYEPRTERHYSDLGFMLLGRIVEAVASQNLAKALTTLVAEPLGLSSIEYGRHDDAAPSAPNERAEQAMISTQQPYPVILNQTADVPWRTKQICGEVLDGNCFHAFGGVAGHAGCFGTATDLLRFARTAAADDSIWQPEVTADVFADGPDSGQALGWLSATVSTPAGLERMLWHPGFTGCVIGFLPGTGSALVLLTNRLMADKPLATDTIWATAVRHTITKGLDR